MTDSAAEPPRQLRRAQALSAGYSDGELARLVRRGELVRLQRGTYLDRPTATAEERYRSVVVATAAGLRVPGVVSHISAAALHGLPLWSVPLQRVHVIRRPSAAGSGSSRVHLHVARLPDDEIAGLEDVLLTDVTRTVVDLARLLAFESAVVAADSALFSRRTTPAQLSECLARMGPVPGSRRAARVLAFADPRSESVGESRSRVLLQRLALPTPDLQVRVRRADRTIIGRCDFGWQDRRTLGEFDGRVKYGRLLRPGQSPGDAVYQEKLREDELRDGGWEVARWTWAQLDTPRVVEQRILGAFARGIRRR